MSENVSPTVRFGSVTAGAGRAATGQEQPFASRVKDQMK